MRIVYMGTPEFAVPSLKAVYEAGHEIMLVVTQPDRKGNRGKLTMPPVKEYAVSKDIPVIQPQRIKNDEETISKLKELNPDLIVVAAFGQILPKSVLDIPKYGCINVHGSLLPKLRGASPMQTAILNGDSVTGVTIMQMAEGLDTGDMISKASFNIEGMDITCVSNLLAEEGAKLLVKTISDIENRTATYEKQDDSISTYAHMISKMDGMTDFNEDAFSIDCKLRAYKEWPTLYSYLHDKQVKFYKAEVVSEDKYFDDPGKVSSVDKKSFTINCKKGQLRILELQMQGKKRMDAEVFLRGSQIKVGDQFCKKEA